MTNEQWMIDMQRSADEHNARLRELFRRHPRWHDESPIEHMLRLAEVGMRESYPPDQIELFPPYMHGGIYAYQRRAA